MSINEALQHLTRQKDKSNKAVLRFRARGRDTKMITKTLAAFELDPEREEKEFLELRSESEKAQNLAKQIEERLEGYNNWKRYVPKEDEG